MGGACAFLDVELMLLVLGAGKTLPMYLHGLLGVIGGGGSATLSRFPR